MTALVHRPTGHAAIRAAARSVRRLPPVDQLLEALVNCRRLDDREGMTLAAHRVVRAATPEIGT